MNRHMIARGAAALALGLIVMSGSAVAQVSEMTEREKSLYEAAQKEGSVTWYITQYGDEAANKVCSAFNAKYPNVKCNYVRSTATVAFQRLAQEIQAKAVQADVFSTNDEFQLVTLKEGDSLEEYLPDNLSHVPQPLKDLGNGGFWNVTAIGTFGIVYNTNLVKPEDAPTSWADFQDPKWKNKLAIAHPGFSGSAGVWAIAMRRLYGDDFFKKLADNNPQIGRSIVDGYNLTASGERAVAVQGVYNIIEGRRKGEPVQEVYPAEGIVAIPGSSAIIKNSPHPNAAKLFMEFLFGTEVSGVLTADYRLPLRDDVAPAPGVKPLSELTLLSVSSEEQAKIEDL